MAVLHLSHHRYRHRHPTVDVSTVPECSGYTVRGRSVRHLVILYPDRPTSFFDFLLFPVPGEIVLTKMVYCHKVCVLVSYEEVRNYNVSLELLDLSANVYQ